MIGGSSELVIVFIAQLLQSIGWAMLHISWLGVLVGLLYSMLRFAMPERTVLRYWAGLAALLALLAAAILLFLLEWSAAAPVASPRFAHVQIVSASSGFFDLMQWLTLPIALVWTVGVFVLALRLAIGFRNLTRLGQRARFAKELDPIVQHWRKMIGVSERVVIKISDEILVPCVFGMARPMLLLPAALLLKIDRTQLELVILHELVHVKRWDAWLNALQLVIETALFFHPVVHWISAHVRNDRELLCDQDVLKASARPLIYARALLNLEEYRQAPQNLAIAFNSGQFSNRVKRILTSSHQTRVKLETKRSAGVIMLSTCLALLAAGLGLTVFAPQNSGPMAQKLRLENPCRCSLQPFCRYNGRG